MEAIVKETKEDHLTAAVIYDATASEMADAALDWIMDYINRQLRREGRHLPAEALFRRLRGFCAGTSKRNSPETAIEKNRHNPHAQFFNGARKIRHGDQRNPVITIHRQRDFPA